MSAVLMPRLSDSMEEGTVLRWLVEPGTEVHRGDELVEIETDKATMTYEADVDGFLNPVAKEGETLPVGALIAHLVADPSASLTSGGTSTQEPTDGPTPSGADSLLLAPQPPAPSSLPPRGAGGGGSEVLQRPKASPLARRLASERGLDLASVRGSGPSGRIVRADIEAAISAKPAIAAQSVGTAANGAVRTETTKGVVTVEELSRTQQVVARRMAESKATVPEFTLTTVVEMAEAVALRARLKDVCDPVPSFNDMIVRACALALRDHPRANGAYRDDHFELYSRINIGVAVAAPDALVVPSVFDADRKGLAEIAVVTRQLADRVRSGEITPPELSGGTFTVSNLGMFGITSFTAVVNPPQAAILAVGAIDKESVMRMTLTCDHRILYGADAAKLLARIRELLERPIALLLTEPSG